MQERLLDAQAVLKQCTPSIELLFKPIKLRDRFHYTILRRLPVRQKIRLSTISFETAEEAKSLKSKLEYAEKLVSNQLATQTDVLKVGTPVSKKFNDISFNGDVTCIKNNLYHIVYDDGDGKYVSK